MAVILFVLSHSLLHANEAAAADRISDKHDDGSAGGLTCGFCINSMLSFCAAVPLDITLSAALSWTLLHMSDKSSSHITDDHSLIYCFLALSIAVLVAVQSQNSAGEPSSSACHT